ncbi:hypothetical protein HZ994_04150 [Akkermansiaceae bacterium]|nr:hypothetical protein HZ994_04150 [Akkermansiaceae bacterium]
MKSDHTIAPFLSLGILMACSSLQAAVIFQDDFTGNPDTGADGLNGESPDTTTGAAAWVSASNFNADGSFLAASGTAGASATLLYTPSSGKVYTLDSRMDVTSTTGWLAMGFASGQSTATNFQARFVTGSTPLGRVWMLMSEGGGGAAWQDGTSVNHVEDNTISVTGTIDMRIVLDTTATTWTATWYAKDATASSYTVIKGTEDVVSQASINSVGFALSGEQCPGTITSFSLSDGNVIPETSSATLLGLAFGFMFVRRRR